MNRFEWVSATTIDDAIDQVKQGAVAKAGGVDLLDRMKEGIDRPPRIVNLRTIEGLDRIGEEEQGLRLGPLVTLASIAASPAVRQGWPALAAAADAAATPNVRNVATVAGNLVQRPRCWYFRSEEFHCLRKGGNECFAIAGENQFHAIFDNDVCAIVHPSAAAVPLMAYRAVLEIDGAQGRREVPLDEFFLLPDTDVTREHTLGRDELIVGISVPRPPAGTRSVYLKKGEKESFDWPLADVATVVTLEGGSVGSASIVLGAAAPAPRRATQAEAFLRGRRLDESTARQAARLAIEGARPLSKNGYKLQMFETLVARALM